MSSLPPLFLQGIFQSPLLFALAGVEFFFTRPDENWLITMRRWLLVLTTLWLVRNGAVMRWGQHAVEMIPLTATLALFTVQALERLLGQPTGEAMMTAGPLAAWLFLSPACQPMSISGFTAYMAGLAVLFAALAVLKAYLYDKILRGDAPAGYGGTPLLLVMITGLLFIASVFRGLIQ